MDVRKAIIDFLLSDVIDDVDNLADDQQLIDSGLIDSISIVKVIIFLEKTFGISLTQDDMTPENFETLGSIVKFVGNIRRKNSARIERSNDAASC